MLPLKIGIILSSTREGRVSPDVGNWVYEMVKDTEGLSFEILDIKDYDLPFLGTTDDTSNIDAWQEKLDAFDGFIFVVAEYNHSITGALKNAIDLVKDEWHNKVAGIVSYGSAGGARAAEHLRGILAELQVATVRSHVLLLLFDDFDNFSDFNPRDLHQDNIKAQLTQLLKWGTAFKSMK